MFNGPRKFWRYGGKKLKIEVSFTIILLYEHRVRNRGIIFHQQKRKI